MFGSTGVGWLYSLANDPSSSWGTVTGFYENLGRHGDVDGEIHIESDVWGILKNMETLPYIGDGFAFYHSTRAGFPENDRHRRRPRISLIGELRDIERDGRNISWISVAVDVRVFAEMRRHPIIRNDATRHLFENCGIVAGHPATMYSADAATWRQFVAMVRVGA